MVVSGSVVALVHMFWHTQVDFSYTPKLHVAFCPIFVHTFWVSSSPWTPSYFSPYFCQTSIFQLFWAFFVKVSESNPILHFAFFCPPLFELYALNPMLYFARFLSTPFELYALNSILLLTLFLSKLQFFSCFEHFSTRCQNRTPCYISGRFCPVKSKIKPYNQPLLNTEHPEHPEHPKTL